MWNIATHTLAYPGLPGRTGTESPDGSTIVSATATQLLFWDVATGKPRPVSLVGVVPDTSFPPVFSADGGRLAELDRTTGSIVVVDLATGRRLGVHPRGWLWGSRPVPERRAAVAVHRADLDPVADQG